MLVPPKLLELLIAPMLGRHPVSVLILPELATIGCDILLLCVCVRLYECSSETSSRLKQTLTLLRVTGIHLITRIRGQHFVYRLAINKLGCVNCVKTYQALIRTLT